VLDFCRRRIASGSRGAFRSDVLQRGADILRLVLGEGMGITLVGVGVGVLGAIGLSSALKSQLFGVGAMDPLTFLGVIFLLALVALAACYLPARRATRVDPMVALRYE
jgi:putative ABC transport system permease protein